MTPVTTDWASWPITKLYAPAPFAARVMAVDGVGDEADHNGLGQLVLLKSSLDHPDANRSDPVDQDRRREQPHDRRRLRAASQLGKFWRGHPEQRVPPDAEHRARGWLLSGAISSTRPRHCTVAAMIPMSLTWMANALAARATA